MKTVLALELRARDYREGLQVTVRSCRLETQVFVTLRDQVRRPFNAFGPRAAAFHRRSAQGLHVFQITLGVDLAREREMQQHRERKGETAARHAVASIHGDLLAGQLPQRNRRCETAYRRGEAVVTCLLRQKALFHGSRSAMNARAQPDPNGSRRRLRCKCSLLDGFSTISPPR